MKTCTTCKVLKDLSEFNNYAKSTDGKQPKCRECCSSYYQEHRGRIRPQIKKAKSGLQLRNREFVMTYLQEHPCVDCGEKDIVVLEFDHLSDKDQSVTRLMHQGASIARIQKEIDKCEVRCCNCHRRITYQRLPQCQRLGV